MSKSHQEAQKVSSLETDPGFPLGYLSFPEDTTMTWEKEELRTNTIDFRAAESHSVGFERAIAGKRRGHEHTVA